jgi:hypothetical protein
VQEVAAAQTKRQAMAAAEQPVSAHTTQRLFLCRPALLLFVTLLAYPMIDEGPEMSFRALEPTL